MCVCVSHRRLTRLLERWTVVQELGLVEGSPHSQKSSIYYIVNVIVL
jgi:hypothetical protein